MNELWITNASPLIVLAKAGMTNLLTDMADEILVPGAVVAEVLAGPVEDPARQLLESGWGQRACPRHIPTVLVEWGLGPGETDVIALALETAGAVVVLDDALGRSCARTFKLPLMGTLGVVLRARRRGLLDSAASAMRSLLRVGFFLDEETIRAALWSIAEPWDADESKDDPAPGLAISRFPAISEASRVRVDAPDWGVGAAAQALRQSGFRVELSDAPRMLVAKRGEDALGVSVLTRRYKAGSTETRGVVATPEDVNRWDAAAGRFGLDGAWAHVAYIDDDDAVHVFIVRTRDMARGLPKVKRGYRIRYEPKYLAETITLDCVIYARLRPCHSSDA